MHTVGLISIVIALLTFLLPSLFKEGKHVTVMIKLIKLWPSIKHKNKINIKIS